MKIASCGFLYLQFIEKPKLQIFLQKNSQGNRRRSPRLFLAFVVPAGCKLAWLI